METEQKPRSEHTVAIVDMQNRIAVLEILGNAADQTLGALRRSVDGDQTEWALGSRHGDLDWNCREQMESWGF